MFCWIPIEPLTSVFKILISQINLFNHLFSAVLHVWALSWTLISSPYVKRHKGISFYPPLLSQNTLYGCLLCIGTIMVGIILAKKPNKNCFQTDSSLSCGSIFSYTTPGFQMWVLCSCMWVSLSELVQCLRFNTIRFLLTRAAICIVCIWKDDRWSECSSSFETCHNVPVYEPMTGETHTPIHIKVYYSSSPPHLQCNDI